MLQKKPSPSIHEIAKEKEEILDQVTINTLNEKVDLEHYNIRRECTESENLKKT